MPNRVALSPATVSRAPLADARGPQSEGALDPGLRKAARARKATAFDARGGLEAKADLTKQQAAISRYLAATWSVTGPLPIAELLREGFAAGVALAVHDFRNQLVTYNGEAEAVNRHLGAARFPVFATYEPGAVQGFEERINALFRKHSLSRDVKASVKRKAPPASFEGSKLHMRLGGTSFEVSVSPGDVEYHRERGRTALNTLVSAIVRQGMSVGLDTFAATYEAALEAERKRMATAVGAAPGMSALSHLVKDAPPFDASKLSPAVLAQLRELFAKLK